MYIKLKAVHNPDFPEIEVPRPTTLRVKDLVDASQKAREWIESSQIGSGNFPMARVFDFDDCVIATVSYNGRVWTSNQQELMYDPYAQERLAVLFPKLLNAFEALLEYSDIAIEDPQTLEEARALVAELKPTKRKKSVRRA